MRHPTAADWLKMAGAFDTPLKERTTEQLNITSCGLSCVHRYGICNAFSYLGLAKNILYDLWPGGRLYWYGLTGRGDRERAFFCIMMAAVGKDLMGMLE